MEVNVNINQEKNFAFSVKAKKQLGILFASGLLLLIVGIIFSVGSSHESSHTLLEEGHQEFASLNAVSSEGHGSGHEAAGGSWVKRIWVNMWINNIFFTGLALIGVFFVAIQYVSNAGWSASIKRIPESFSQFLPLGFILMLTVFGLGYHDIFHWTHEGITNPDSEHYDEIIAGKAGFLNIPFFLARMIIFFLTWMMMAWFLRKESLKEDLNGGTKHYRKMIHISLFFIIFFAVSSSISAWDWVMSIDTHWFSTMFGWYVFASWFVAGLAAITYAVIQLKEAGYLSIVNENHIHDLGKFVFAFSIFWAYIWFSQFLLIYYANIPEETIYFLERLESDYYFKFIIVLLILNFFFPFLVLMTRDAKRKVSILKIVCLAVVIGHWFDFYQMITPATLNEQGGLGGIEIGLVLIYVSVFAYIVMNALSKVALIPKNHPLLQESIHHHI